MKSDIHQHWTVKGGSSSSEESGAPSLQDQVIQTMEDDRIVQKDEQARNGFYRNKEMYIFLGHFRSSLERFEKLVEGGDLENQIQLLQQEYDQLKPLVNEGAISRRIASATDKIDELMLSYLFGLVYSILLKTKTSSALSSKSYFSISPSGVCISI